MQRQFIALATRQASMGVIVFNFSSGEFQS
jgi:hypothetical protein